MNPDSANTPAAPAKPRFSRTFWTLNTIEMWERLAFYNLRVMAPIYIMQADNPGGLHLTAMDKGTIYAWWAAFQSLLPIITGGYTLFERNGFAVQLSNIQIIVVLATIVLLAVSTSILFPASAKLILSRHALPARKRPVRL